ncbi:MAG: hypothetical protein ACKVQS_03115 [Fimbriimonadaceae bacterium]
MMIAATLLATVIQPAYMQHAQYPAGSLIEDTQSPGGNATSDNFPKQFGPGRYTDFITLNRQGEKINIAIANKSNETIWLRAADGNMLAWLEAKDGKTWRPIQWHYQITCGNSYHQIALQPGFVFVYTPTIPTGTLKTEVRFALYQMNEGGSAKPTYSHSVETTIDPNLFKLDPKQYPKDEVSTEWVTPTLRPKQ